MSSTVIRISIKKILPAGTYAYGQMETLAFASEYLVQSEAAFPSPQLVAYAHNLAHAESRMFPVCVRFERAQVKFATPDASAEDLRYQKVSVDFPDLRGQWPIEEGDTLAFPPVTAVYGRETHWGTHGRLHLPYVVTTAEWNLYTQTRTLPERFSKPSVLNASSAPSFFSQQLTEAVSAEGGRHVMVSATTPADQTDFRPRSIQKFYLKGLQVPGKPKRRNGPKTKQKAALRRAALAAIKNGTEFDFSAVIAATKGKSKGPVAGIVYLLKAGPHYKIGKSTNFDKRLSQIKLQLPHAVEVIHVIRAADHSGVESHWHRRFAARRLNGEWFELTEADVSEFKSASEM